MLTIDAPHIDAVQSVTGPKDSLITLDQARELLSAPSGTRPRMYGLTCDEADNHRYEIVTLASDYYLDKYAPQLVAQWLSGTTLADLISPA